MLQQPQTFCYWGKKEKLKIKIRITGKVQQKKSVYKQVLNMNGELFSLMSHFPTQCFYQVKRRK